jgi:hypothetical protein
LFLSEAGHRAWLRSKGTPHSARDARASIQRAANPLSAYGAGVIRGRDANARRERVLHPYTGSESQHDQKGVLAFFRDGVSPETYVIVVVGGSVAYEFVDNVGESLARSIGADPRFTGRRVVVLNYAHHTYKEPQQLTRLAYLMSIGYVPDAVINIDGFNEIALAIDNWSKGIFPLYPHQTMWQFALRQGGPETAASLDLLAEMWSLRKQAKRLVELERRWGLSHSSLCSRYLLARLGQLGKQRAELFDRYAGDEEPAVPGSEDWRETHGPDSPKSRKEALELCARGWYESSVSNDALCSARSVAYLHVLQPTLYDAGSKRLTAEEQTLHDHEMGTLWRPAVRIGYPLLRELGGTLVERGVAFLDASQAFAGVDQTLYYDNCHFSQEGHEILERAIAKSFLERLPPTRGAR